MRPPLTMPGTPGHSQDGGPLRRGRRRPGLASVLAGALLVLILLAIAGTGYTWEPYPEPGRAGASVSVARASVEGSASPAEAPDPGEARKKRAERRALQRRISGIGPRGVYIVIDSANNRLWVRSGEEILLEAVVSTGSGLVLRQVDADRSWTFDTPMGMHRIHRRAENPVWVKPDWAFLEEGEPVPARDSERYDYGALGEYGLYFGNGYIIHGTLYENFLGRSVSHGCVRVGRDDLRQIWMLAPVGTPVIVF